MAKRVMKEVKPKITHIMSDGTICEDISKKEIPVDSGAYEIIAAIITKQIAAQNRLSEV